MSVSPRVRTAGAAALGTLAALMIAATVLTVWADRVLLDEDRFSARLASGLEDDTVNRYLASEITQRLVARVPELITVRPAIEPVVSEALRSRTAIAAARTALREVHRSMRAGVPPEAIVLDLRAALVLADALLRQSAPDMADRIAIPDAARISGEVVGLHPEVFQQIERLSRLMPLFAAGSVITVAALLAVAPSRHAALMGLAGALAGAGLIGLAGEWIVEHRLAGTVPGPPEARPALFTLWRTVLVDYRAWNIILLTGGLVVAAGIAASEGLPHRPEARERVLASTWGRAIAGAALALAGIAMVRWPMTAVTMLIVTAGIVAASVGATLLLRSALEAVRHSHLALRYAVRWAPRSIVPVAVGVVLLGLVLVLSASLAAALTDPEPQAVRPPPEPEITICNGHEELCDRPLNEVVFAGTHNSMAAAAEPGWYFAQHRNGIPEQLRAGIRLLLIDTFYGLQTGRGVRTLIEAPFHRDYMMARYGEEVVLAAEQVAARLLPGGDRGLFLCHAFCELGATPMQAALAGIRDFLDAHPGEFLVIFVQDQTAPETTVAEFARAGLAERAYAHPPGEPWPTLRELLESGKQLLVLAEARPGAAEWYQPAWLLVQDTPYDVRDTAQFSCVRNRGAADREMLLLNHFVAGAVATPNEALGINSYETLMDHVQACQQEHGRIPNLIAVNFYDAGDLLRVVDELNGVGVAE